MTKQTYLAPFHILAAVAAVLAAGAASAQTQQPAPTDPQATAPPAATAPPTATTPSTTPAPSGGKPMQGMEHGRQMRGMGPQMMEKEKGKAGEHPGMGGGPMMGK